MRQLNKAISITVLVCFLVNTAISDYAFALATAPGSRNPGTQEAMYALGQKLFAAKVGPGAIDFDKATPTKFVGEPVEVPGVKFVKADYRNLPKGWELNPILSKKMDLIEAFKYFRDHEAQLPADSFDIKEGYYKLEKGEDGELPISRWEYDERTKDWTLIIHTDFVKKWNDIRKNDIWFEYTGQARTVSVAWAIFYRIAKHEMADLKVARYRIGLAPHVATMNEYILPKGGGHMVGYMAMRDNIKSRETRVEESELAANMIGGHYAFINDAIWMWFLGSYCFGPATQYNNKTLKNRLDWFFGLYGTAEERDEVLRNLRLDQEFPNLKENNEASREWAVNLALLINKEYYSKKTVAQTTEKYEANVSSLIDIITRAMKERPGEFRAGHMVDESMLRLIEYISKAIGYFLLNKRLPRNGIDIEGIQISETEPQGFAVRVRRSIPSNLDENLKQFAVTAFERVANDRSSLIFNRIHVEMPPLPTPVNGILQTNISAKESNALLIDTISRIFGVISLDYLDRSQILEKVEARLNSIKLEREYEERAPNITEVLPATGKGEEARGGQMHVLSAGIDDAISIDTKSFKSEVKTNREFAKEIAYLRKLFKESLGFDFRGFNKALRGRRWHIFTPTAIEFSDANSDNEDTLILAKIRGKLTLVLFARGRPIRKGVIYIAPLVIDKIAFVTEKNPEILNFFLQKVEGAIRHAQLNPQERGDLPPDLTLWHKFVEEQTSSARKKQPRTELGKRPFIGGSLMSDKFVTLIFNGEVEKAIEDYEQSTRDEKRGKREALEKAKRQFNDIEQLKHMLEFFKYLEPLLLPERPIHAIRVIALSESLRKGSFKPEEFFDEHNRLAEAHPELGIAPYRTIHQARDDIAFGRYSLLWLGILTEKGTRRTITGRGKPTKVFKLTEKGQTIIFPLLTDFRQAGTNGEAERAPSVAAKKLYDSITNLTFECKEAKRSTLSDKEVPVSMALLHENVRIDKAHKSIEEKIGKIRDREVLKEVVNMLQKKEEETERLFGIFDSQLPHIKFAIVVIKDRIKTLGQADEAKPRTEPDKSPEAPVAGTSKRIPFPKLTGSVSVSAQGEASDELMAFVHKANKADVPPNLIDYLIPLIRPAEPVTITEMLDKLRRERLIRKNKDGEYILLEETTSPLDRDVIRAIEIILRDNHKLRQPEKGDRVEPVVMHSAIIDSLRGRILTPLEQFNAVHVAVAEHNPTLAKSLESLRPLIGAAPHKKIIDAIDVLPISSGEKDIVYLAFTPTYKEIIADLQQLIVKSISEQNLSGIMQFAKVYSLLKEHAPGLVEYLDSLSYLTNENNATKIARTIGGLNLPKEIRAIIGLAFLAPNKGRHPGKSPDETRPRFGSSGNAVDTQFMEAQKLIKERGNYADASTCVHIAINLLREVDIDEVDSSDNPIADKINFVNVAINVLTLLKRKGLSDSETDKLLQYLKEGKNDLELKQAFGYDDSNTSYTGWSERHKMNYWVEVWSSGKVSVTKRREAKDTGWLNFTINIPAGMTLSEIANGIVEEIEYHIEPVLAPDLTDADLVKTVKEAVESWPKARDAIQQFDLDTLYMALDMVTSGPLFLVRGATEAEFDIIYKMGELLGVSADPVAPAIQRLLKHASTESPIEERIDALTKPAAPIAGEIEAVVAGAQQFQEEASRETMARVAPLIDKKDWDGVAGEFNKIQAEILALRSAGKDNVREHAKFDAICEEILGRGLWDEFSKSAAFSKLSQEAQRQWGIIPEEDLLEILEGWTARIERNKGPGAFTHKDLEGIYKIVELFHNSQIEIFMPQKVKLTEAIKIAIAKIKKRKGEEVIRCREYSGSDNLAKLLSQPAPQGVQRIVVSEESLASGIAALVQSSPSLFAGVRIYNAALPENYDGMEKDEKTLHQAKLMNIAILARLFEKGKTPRIEMFLREYLTNSLEGGEKDADEFIANLQESEDEAKDTSKVTKRILFFLGKIVRLTEILAREMRLMKEFWTAA